jgi:hypothetical protein
MAFASANGKSPASEPLPAIRNLPELYTTIRSTPPASSNFADMPVPAPAPITGIPSLMCCFSLFSIDIVFCNVSASIEKQSIKASKVYKCMARHCKKKKNLVHPSTCIRLQDKQNRVKMRIIVIGAAVDYLF